MVPLVNVAQHNIALLFCTYLKTQQIAAQVKPTTQGFDIYCQADKLIQAKQLFDEFITNPFADKYQQIAWQQGELTDVKSNAPNLLTLFKTQFLAHAGWFTLFIFSACWLVFLLSIVGYGLPLFQQLQFFPYLTLSALISEPWRLIGPALFHFSWLHIVFNTLWWWQLGGEIEKKLNSGLLIQVFLITAIVSNLGQFLVSGPNFGGLSGVVYGLVGFVWILGYLAPEKGLFMPKPLIGILLFWMLLGFIDVLPMNMANTAHFLGLISGCLLAWFAASHTPKNT
jgi:GlpG protein